MFTGTLVLVHGGDPGNVNSVRGNIKSYIMVYSTHDSRIQCFGTSRAYSSSITDRSPTKAIDVTSAKVGFFLV